MGTNGEEAESHLVGFLVEDTLDESITGRHGRALSEYSSKWPLKGDARITWVEVRVKEQQGIWVLAKRRRWNGCWLTDGALLASRAGLRSSELPPGTSA